MSAGGKCPRTQQPIVGLEQGFSNGALLGSTGQLSWSHDLKPSLGSFAEAFTSINIAKHKCPDIKYSPAKLKFVVFIVTSYTSLVTFGDAFFWNALELFGTLWLCF